MARRYAGKASPRTVAVRARGGRGKPKTAVSESALRERLIVLERERDVLRAALEREQERTRKLEEVQAAARDRIAWALESLNNILDPKG
jgi:predicted NBD/HSP70 family sugar kinase